MTNNQKVSVTIRFRKWGMFIALFISACSRPAMSECPIAGHWVADGKIPFEISFQPGEAKMMGMVNKVAYQTNGSVITVIYQDGPMKGQSISYTKIDSDTIKNPMIVLRRAR